MELSPEKATRFAVRGMPEGKTAYIGRINPLPTKELEESARLGGAVDTGKWYIQRFFGDQCGIYTGAFETREEALKALAEEIN